VDFCCSLNAKHEFQEEEQKSDEFYGISYHRFGSRNFEAILMSPR
jgi:hypothetical protein